MSDLWARLEGHSVNGVFRLHRYLGSSNHSVVFLTGSASELALKLVPAVPALAQLQLARWRASAALSHQHLMPIVEAGQCQIGERPFLYVVTEYADQNLAQLLERRALTEDETREMLSPVLDSLAFLHDKKLVQGRLKPSNILVVGDQIKLASDTIRPFSETGRAANVASAYMPPEARDGVRTGASDVWALGVTLSEALTRQQPTALFAGDMVLPAAMSSAFRGVVARCLSRKASGRPTVSELQMWSRGAKVIASLSASGMHRALSNASSSDVAMEIARESEEPEPAPAAEAAGSSRTRGARLAPQQMAPSPPKSSMGMVILVIIVAFAIFVMGWAAVRSSGARSSGPAAPDSVVNTLSVPEPTLVQTASAATTPVGERVLSGSNDVAGASAVDVAGSRLRSQQLTQPTPQQPTRQLPQQSIQQPVQRSLRQQTSLPSAEQMSATRSQPASGSAEDPSYPAVNEVIPDVPERARKSIRGRVRVSVRLIVDKDGKVFAALVDKPGPSRYFERLALDAAEQWIFPPSTTGAERLMLVRFDFSRGGATAHAELAK